MESAESVYVLCSRYSKECARFISKAQPLEFIRPIFIDNAAAREAVLSSSLGVQSVPCVLGSVNGYVATYEGRDAFSWLDDMLATYVQDEHAFQAPAADDPSFGEVNPEKVNAHVTHKIDAKEAAERMRKEREQDDDMLSNPRRRAKEFDEINESRG